MIISSEQVAIIGGARAKKEICAEIAKMITERGKEFDLDTPLRVAHFLGQTSVESGGFSAIAESLNYSAAGLRKTFGRHRISDAQCNKLGRTKAHPADQRGIANIIYGGAWGAKNLGNTRPNDGWDFRGSGIKQVTGRSNVRAFTKWIKKYVPDAPDFEATPDLLRDPKWAVWSAVWYWSARGCSRFADADNVTGLTERINGGRNGLSARRSATAKAKKVLKAGAPEKKASKEDVNGVLRKGDHGVHVKELQEKLTRAGYPLEADGDFGIATDKAVRAFQKDNGLRIDGEAGQRTMTKLGEVINAIAVAPKIRDAEDRAESAEEKVDRTKTAVDEAETKAKGRRLPEWMSGISTLVTSMITFLSGVDWMTVLAIIAAGIVVVALIVIFRAQIIAAFKDVRAAVEEPGNQEYAT